MARKKKTDTGYLKRSVTVSEPAALISAPDAGARALCSINPGTLLIAHQEADEWTLVSFGLVAGWIRTNQIEG